ncbi:EAL domain-containing protein [Thiomicrorhabdus sp.]|uniref:EAL domain-containing protein n=1 Tax=Thiomicrorhabdus sp. TaxID=2039724 RepID=UPI002AA7D654|nr:EAL domain-containing protein [Thiomicrorhabdus sp.]
MLEGLIGLTKLLHRHVIAEGIETERHGTMLIELGCTYGQGYFIAKPMTNEKVPEWLKQWKRPKSWVEQLSFAEQEVI